MNILLHGDDVAKSRDALSILRFDRDEVITFDGKSANLGEIKQACESISLFGEKRVVIIENLFSRLTKNELKEIISYLSSIDTNYDIIIWEGKLLTKTAIGKLGKKWQAKEFSLPKVIFTLMESVRPKNNVKMLELLQKAKELKVGNEFIFLMLVRQIRMLILAKDKGLGDMPFWMAGKFEKQAEYFKIDQLLLMYKKLLAIDIRQKTGAGAFDLGGELDLLFATL
ncbi:hypothetical protein HYT02_00530 [Candidatus Gottesmanbacteria bacterium]|nr:hypothetical protein [Candidatus Gottesmanbacteria bacterium]